MKLYGGGAEDHLHSLFTSALGGEFVNGHINILMVSSTEFLQRKKESNIFKNIPNLAIF